MKYTFVIDVDNTLSVHDPDVFYQNHEPIHDMILKVNRMYDEGHTIILFSARGQKSNKGDLQKIEQNVRPILEEWLNKHKVKYHFLILGKPWGENVVYIDDRSMRPDEFLSGKEKYIEDYSKSWFKNLS